MSGGKRLKKSVVSSSKLQTATPYKSQTQIEKVVNNFIGSSSKKQLPEKVKPPLQKYNNYLTVGADA